MEDAILFADSLVSSRPELARRGWSTLTSFAVQAIAATVLLTLPLFRTTGLPALRHISTPISLGEPLPTAPAGPPHRGSVMAPAHPAIIVFRPISQIRSSSPDAGSNDAPTLPGSGPYLPTGGQGRDPSGLRELWTDGTRPVLPSPPAKPAPSHFRISQMNPGDLLRKVQPLYPPLARSARIQGVVVLQATIGKDGRIENLHVLSGHPMLAPAAIEAVRQWRYRPYILNGEPVEVETEITVNFSFGEN
jgi:periplasmic protein TonB